MPVSDQTPRARQISAAVALAVVGFFATALALHAAIVSSAGGPLRLHADVRSEKLVMLDGWRGRIFSAAFGSSHVHNGFDPRAFDAALAGTPLATRSANLAIEGGSQTEQSVMAQQFLTHLESPAQAGAAAQPCLVLLELEAGANFTPDHLVHPRSINIYDWPTTHLASEFVSPAMPVTQRAGRVGFAYAAMGLHYLNLGMLSNRIFAPPLSQEILTGQTADDRRGELVEATLPTAPAYMQHIVDSAPQTPTITTPPLLRGSYDLVTQLANDAPQEHLSFVYMVMPRLANLDSATDYPDHLTAPGPQGPLEVPIINLGRPDHFPQLFQLGLYHDDAHLAGPGATLASTLLAKQLVRWYATHGAPPRC